jgi:hypothetical protein
VWNQPIPPDADVDPASDLLVTSLVSARDQRSFAIAVSEWTVPVYFADQQTPRVDVAVAGRPPGALNDPSFVHDVPSTLAGIPIPAGAEPDPEADGHLTIVDRANGCEYDLYGARRSADGWTAQWANSLPVDGNGIYPYGLSTRASGFAPLAGLIWPDELAAGEIQHALLFAYPYTRAGGPVTPATASDGKTDSEKALPIGARVQLDPSLDLRTLGLEGYELTIARALQRYGMILGDTGGALALYAVNAHSLSRPAYDGLLPSGPIAPLEKIPVGSFRVLRLPPQSPYTPLRTVSSRCSGHA